MTKREIKYDEVPRIIQEALSELIWKEPEEFPSVSSSGERPQGLGFSKGIPFEQKTSIGGMINYCFETTSDQEALGLAPASLVFRYDQKSGGINYVIFRLYGETRKTYIEMLAGLTYDSMAYDMEWNRMLEPDWDLEKMPKRVVVQLDGQEVFRWVAGQDAPIVLKEALGMEVCTARDILGRFTEMAQGYVTKDGQKSDIKTSVIKKTTVYDFLQTYADKFKGRMSEKKVTGNEENDEENDEEYSEYTANLRKYAELINDPEGDYRVEPDVLEQAIRELSLWLNAREKAEQYEKGSEEYMQELLKVNLPNLAFLGEPGTGKSELAKNMATKVLGAEWVELTGGSALKGNYIGQTRSAVVEKFIQLRKCEDSKPAILFIDEAYDLFNNKDNFGAEVIEILLKALGDGTRVLDAKKPCYGKEDEDLEVTLLPHTAVWFAGYEKDMRKALSVNRGMYRRVKTITLPTPGIDALWYKFQKCMNQDKALTDKGIQTNWKLCESREKYIREYFVWARSKTYAEFFGNYSGVKKLAEEITKSSLLKGRPLDELSRDLEDIIERQKTEIRTQYQQVIEAKYERLPFMVYTDVEETFDNYIGAEEAKEKLRHVIDMVYSPEKFPGCDSPKGALLVGSPGTGKTFLARCMAGTLRKEVQERSLQKDVAFVKVAATELRTEELVKALFCASESYDYVIIFIDEIDAIGKRRELLLNPSVLIQLMNELDGFEGKNNVFVLAATNAPEVLDAALKRPGRFDMNIEVSNPNDEDRRKLVEHYIGWKKCSEDLLSEVAKHFRGCSPVQIKTILNEAKILYHDCEQKLHDQKIRESETAKVGFAHRVKRDESDLKAGIECVTLGDGTKMLVSAKDNKDNINETLFLMDFREVLARRMIGERTGLGKNSKGFSLERNDNGLSATAIHEVGHALVSVLRGRSIEKITILQRGDVLGYVSPDAEEELITKQDYLNRLDICFGGRAAEEIIYGPEYVSSGAAQDIQTASRLARYMIMQLGMSEKVGPVALETASGRYLGGGNQMLCTESTMTMAEDEVRKLLKERYSATLETLRTQGELLKKLAKDVFEKEEVFGEDFVKLVEKMRESSN